MISTKILCRYLFVNLRLICHLPTAKDVGQDVIPQTLLFTISPDFNPSLFSCRASHLMYAITLIHQTANSSSSI